MKTIVITGSNGFIGSNLVNSLCRENKLILLLSVKSKQKKLDISITKILHLSTLKTTLN